VAHDHVARIHARQLAGRRALGRLGQLDRRAGMTAGAQILSQPARQHAPVGAQADPVHEAAPAAEREVAHPHLAGEQPTARAGGGDPLAAVRAASRAVHEQTGRSAGNGSLMRTGVVGLAFLNGDDAYYRCRDAALAISGLTHFDPLAGDACVLWSEGVRQAVLHSTPGLWRFGGVRNAVAFLPIERRQQWSEWLDEAEAKEPYEFQPNGFVVPALQAAWSAIYHTRIPERPEDHFRLALEAAVRAGDDTDTVAAIAGVLLGAAWGRAAIPEEWQRVVHGWPGLDAEGLAELAARIIA